MASGLSVYGSNYKLWRCGFTSLAYGLKLLPSESINPQRVCPLRVSEHCFDSDLRHIAMNSLFFDGLQLEDFLTL